MALCLEWMYLSCGSADGVLGYEEAAALGLLAGWNAGLFAVAQRKAVLRKRNSPETAASAPGESVCCPASAAGSSLSSNRFVLPECLVLNPTNSMTGAIAEQLTARDATEPLRAFAARVTSRLSMRCDNAADRMLPEVLQGGLYDANHLRVKRTRRRMAEVRALVALIRYGVRSCISPQGFFIYKPVRVRLFCYMSGRCP